MERLIGQGDLIAGKMRLYRRRWAPDRSAVTVNGTGKLPVGLSGSNNTISLGNRNSKVSRGQSIAIGNSTVSLSGSGNSVTLGNGDENVTINGGSNKVAVGNGNGMISMGGGGSTVTTGNGNQAITLGSTGDARQ
jgi:hypothetical protein